MNFRVYLESATPANTGRQQKNKGKRNVQEFEYLKKKSASTVKRKSIFSEIFFKTYFLLNCIKIENTSFKLEQFEQSSDIFGFLYGFLRFCNSFLRKSIFKKCPLSEIVCMFKYC